MNSSIQKTSRWLVVAMAALVASLAGPAARADTQLACDDGNAGGLPPADLCIEADDADTPWRYVGKTIGPVCPDPQGWSAQKLFAQPGGQIPPGLDRFCLFVADTAQPNLQALAALRCTSPGAPDNCLSQLDPDSASVAMMASDTADLIWEPLREYFLDQVGSIDPLPAGPPVVRLAVIDTEPTGVNEDRNGAGTSQHGFTLINMLRDLICPVAGPCAVQLKSRLALPLVRCASPTGFCTDTVDGGYAGTISELARAIRAEVADWSDSNVENLVINLSVAWDSLFGGAQPIANSRVAVQAAYRALQDASCRGALVLAAAGNRVTGPDTFTGPLYPGGWETEPAPDAVACDSLLGMPPDPADLAGSYRPLVYASSAVRADNTPAETRVQGEPRLTAFGDHGVSRVDDTGVPQPTQILTGSSVATAVVSAAAAAAWHYRAPDSAHEIMATVYESGFGLGRAADFCNGTSPCSREVRRVSVCHAVEEACDGLPAGTCPVLDCTAPGSVLSALPEQGIAQLYAAAPAFSLTQLGAQMPLDACRSGFVIHWNGGPVVNDPCPHLQYYGLQATPWTDGQPEGQFCPTCVDRYRSPGTLYAEIDSSLQGTLSAVTLLCRDNGYRIPGQFVAGDKLVIKDIPEACESEGVALAYRLDNGTGSPASVASPSLLIPDRDDDGVQDGLDNCVDRPNADQIDADGDGIGNACDGDFTGDCATNFPDLQVMALAFFGNDPVTDLNSDGIVNFPDLTILSELFFAPPGPSGIDNICAGGT